MAKYDVMVTRDGRLEMPYEMWQICKLLAKRRGETPQAIFNKIIMVLLKFDEIEGGRAKLQARLKAAERYCKAEGFEDTEEYLSMDSFLGSRAALRRILKELRAETWRTDYNGHNLDDVEI